VILGILLFLNVLEAPRIDHNNDIYVLKDIEHDASEETSSTGGVIFVNFRVKNRDYVALALR